MSVISEEEDVTAVSGIEGINHPSDSIWTEERNENVRDYEVIGFVVF